VTDSSQSKSEATPVGRCYHVEEAGL